jgi:hypothetical protein
MAALAAVILPLLAPGCLDLLGLWITMLPLRYIALTNGMGRCSIALRASRGFGIWLSKNSPEMIA